MAALSEPTYIRGLTRREVAFIKTMTAYGYKRDYVMSFIVRPGRVISRACINDVVVKNRAPDVPPATWEECEAFMQRRLAEAA